MTTAANVIRLFTVVSYKFLLSARVFAPHKPFQGRIVFVGKAGVCPSETPFRCSLSGRLRVK